jgi:pimeloyl-ACP methyl ester carboxylesterase
VSAPEAPGLSLLLKAAYESELSPAVAEALLAWLGAHGDAAVWKPQPREAWLRTGAGWIESPCEVDGGAGELAGIRCEPSGGAAPGTPWTLFLSAGGIRRCGPNRMWTRAARVLAERGRPSLRIDVRDTGDSDGVSAPHTDLEAMYSAASVDDVVRAYDWLKAQGAGDIDVVGLCSGSFLGAQLAAVRKVRHALLFNGLVYVWNDEARGGGMEQRLGSAFSDGRQWKRLLSGQVDVVRLARAVWARGRGAVAKVFHRAAGRTSEDEVAALLRTGAERGTQFRLVSSVGDPSIAYLERHVPPEARPPLTLIPGVDHTLRPAWAHPRVMDLVLDTL